MCIFNQGIIIAQNLKFENVQFSLITGTTSSTTQKSVQKNLALPSEIKNMTKCNNITILQ